MKQLYALLFVFTSFLSAYAENTVLSNDALFNCPGTVSYSNIKKQTKCGHPYGGTVSATLTGGSYTTLKYVWYDADHLNDPDYIIGTGDKLANLTAGSYRVVITDTKTDCRWVGARVNIGKDVPDLNFFVKEVKNVIGCNRDPVGFITLHNPENYKTYWTDDKGKQYPVYQAQDYIANIPPGVYYIVAENPSSGCKTEPFEIRIEGWPIRPRVQASILADTSCTGGSGRISTITNTPLPGREPEGGYLYSWSTSSGTPLSQFNNQPVASPLPAGTYNLNVTGNYADAAYNCDSTYTFVIPHQPTYPIISLSSTPNTVCNPALASTSYTGRITVGVTYKGKTITNFSNYTFKWVNSTGGTGSVTGTNIIPNMNGGTYTITATNTSIGCSAADANIVVQNTLPSQTLTLNTTAQTSCNGTPNGAITAVYTINPASTSAPVLKWYHGTSATPANVFTTGVSGNTASNLAGGQTYTVQATDPVTGCQATTSVIVPLQQGVVTVTATPSPNSICAPSTAVNGRVTITEVRFNNTIVTDFTGYTFSWSKESGNSFVAMTGQTGRTITNQPAGRYRVVVSRTDLQCSSTPATVEIVDQLPTQTLTLAPTAQTSCGGVPNGRITASYSISSTSASTAPSYRWFIGTSVSGTPLPATNLSSPTTAINLAGDKTYTVEATDPASGCKTITSVYVPLQPATITLTTTKTANGICAPATAYNGSITVSGISFNGGTPTTTFTGYTFAWAKEVNGSFTPISGATSSSLSGQNAGRYRVVVTHTALQCSSLPVTVEIVDQLPVLALSLTATPQTSCGTLYNGSILASLSKDATTLSSGYSLRWFKGSTVDAATEFSVSGNTAAALQGGITYTVEATDAASGCKTVSAVLVPLQPSVVTLSATPSPNSICDPVNNPYSGSISVSSVSLNGTATTNFTGYTFSWSQEINGVFTAISGQTGPSLSKLNGGRYQVLATNTALGCSASPITVVVDNTPPTQTLTLAPTAQTSCGGVPNGRITASYSISPTSASTAPSYRWFIGTSVSGTPLPATNLSSPTTAINLAGDKTYTVEATDPASGCKTITSVYVPLQPATITLTTTKTANGICAPATAYNGSITVSGISFNGGTPTTTFTGYTFAWAKEVNGSFTPITGATSASLSGQNAGRYRVVVTHTALQCSSLPVTVEIVDQLPVLALSLTATPQTSCGTLYNGSILASLSKDATTLSSGYSLRWFKGSTVDAATEFSVSGNTAAALQGGITYTVEATDAASGCKTVSAVLVPLQPSVVTLSATPSPNSICDPVNNPYSGSISVSSVSLNGTATTNFTGYTFSWSQEINGVFTAISGQTGPSLSKLNGGRYQVLATNTALGCSASPITVVVDNTPPTQTLTLAPTAQTSCGGVPNGRITASYSISPTSASTAPSYRWFIGTSVSGTPLPATNLSSPTTAINLAGDKTYTVEATDPASGCKTITSVYVPLQPATITLTTTKTANTVCSPVSGMNGSISLDQVFINTVAEADFTGYTFEWYKEVNGSFGLVNGATGSTLNGLSPGRYQVIATNTALECTSIPVTIEVVDALPVLSLDLVPAAQTSCNGTPNGSLTANYAISPASTSSYTLKWYTGTAVVAANEFAVTGNTATDLAGGLYYTVEATDSFSGCKTVSSVYVPKADGVVTFDHQTIANLICDPSLAAPGTYGGAINISQVYFNSAAEDATNYTFTWYKEVSGSFNLITGETGNSLTNIAPGRYQVEVVKNGLACTTGRVTIEVADTPAEPVLALKVERQQEFCAAPYSGSISAAVTVNGVVAPLSDYRFEWYTGTSILGTAVDPNNLSGTSNSLADKLNKGYYTVRAINNATGCVAITTIYMPELLVQPQTKLTVTQIQGCLSDKKGSVLAQVFTNTTGTNTEVTNYGDYTFAWYRGQSTTGTLITATGGQLLDQLADGTDLPSGYYTVVATNTITSCQAPPQTGFLKAPVAVSNDYVVNRKPSACKIDYGIATVWVVDGTGTPNTTDYTFEWYVGRPTDPNANYYTDPKVKFAEPVLTLIPTDPAYDYTTNITGTVYPTTNASFTEGPTAYGLMSGIYTVVITDENGCKSLMEVAVAYEDAPESLVMRLDHVLDCLGSTGEAGVKAVDISTGVPVPFPDQSDYQFYLYKGGNVIADSLIAGPVTGPGTASLIQETVFDQLLPGTYTMIAVEWKGTGCSSTSKVFEIYQVAQPPVVNAGDIVPSTMCEGGNGEASFTISNASYREGELDYALTDVTISWTSWPGFPDATLRPADENGILTITNPLETDIRKQAKEYVTTFTGLAAGPYTFRVTGNTGCFSDETLEIPGNPAQPTITAIAVNQTYCAPVNGAIDITGITGGSANQADYTFYLYQGQQNLFDGIALSSGSIATIEGLVLGADTYYLIASQNTNTGAGSGCLSAPLEIRIRNVSVYPTVSISSKPDESCDPAESTGELTATITTATGIYSYQWFLINTDGSLSPQGTPGTETTPALLTDLAPGRYRIDVVAENGCPVSAEIQLGEQIIVPTITQVVATPQTSCNPLVTDAGITVQEITYNGTAYAAPFTGFTFIWRDANGAVIPGFSGAVINSRLAGSYSVEVYKTSNPSKNCMSAPYTIEVPYTPLFPTATLTSTVNESCDPLVFTGTVTPADLPAGNYTYQWYKNGSATGMPSGNQSTIAPLTAQGPGRYSILVTAANGCQVSAEVEVGELIVVPVITKVVAMPQTSCDPSVADGRITVEEVTYNGATYTAPFADFTFEWKDANGNIIAGFSGASITGRVTGTYSVEVFKSINPHMNCHSAPYTIDVPYVPLFPTATLSATPNASCDPAQSTGMVTPADLPAGNYTFQWYKNGSATGMPSGDQSTLAPLTAQGAGTYSLQITSANGCQVSAEVELTDELVVPIVSIVTAKPQTSCDPSVTDGTITVEEVTYKGTAYIAPFTGFTFVWRDANGAVIPGFSGAVISARLAGSYSVEVYKTSNPSKNCMSAPYTIEVPYTPLFPTATLTSTVNESCDPLVFTGMVTPADLPAGNYTFQWYKNGSATGMPSGDQSTIAPLTAQGPGRYSILVTAANGCQVSAEVEVGELIVVPVITKVVAMPQTSCDPSVADGRITVEEVTYNGATYTAPFADFTFEWKDANGNIIAGFSGASITGRVTGTYSVEVFKSINPHMNCHSAPYTIDVPYVPLFPTATLSATPNASCDPAQSTGMVTPADLPAGNYTFQWYKNGSATGMPSGDQSTLAPLTAQGAGTYSLQITSANGCQVSAEVELTDELVVPIVSIVTATPQTSCDPSVTDGTITVEEVTYNGTAYAAPFTGFTFIWRDANGAVIPGFSGAVISARLAGSYSVEVYKTSNPSKNCMSAPYTIEVPYTPLFPTATLTSTVNESCDPLVFTGMVTPADLPAGNYTFQWYKNGSATGMPSGDQSTIAPLTAQGPGRYSILVTAANGCQVSAEVEVGELIVVPVITKVVAMPQTSCDPSVADGRITVEEVTYNGATYTAPFADFTFEWKDANGNIIAGFSGASITGRVTGTYSVEVFKSINPHMNCHSAPYTIDVPYVPLFPTATLSATPNASCDPAQSTGMVTPADLPAGNYTFQWYKNGSATGMPSGDQSTLAPLTAQGAGTYSLQITSANGCQVSAEVELTDELVVPIVSIVTAKPQTSCDPSVTDGTITVEEVTYKGTAYIAPFTGFTFVWRDANGAVIPGFSGAVISARLAGSYSVEVYKTSNPSKNCMSAPYTIEVPYTPLFPAISQSTVNNTSCNAATPNGIITAILTDFGSSYSYSLYFNGSTTSLRNGTNQTAATLTLDKLSEGDYRLEVRAANGCLMEVTSTLDKEDVTGTLTLSATEKQYCNSFGSITVGELTFAGQSYTGAQLANFRFWLVDENNQTMTNVAAITTAGVTFSGLKAGNYQVFAERNIPATGTAIGQGCPISGAKEVLDISVDPVIEVVEYNMISHCFGSQKGLLAVSVDGSITPSSRYTASWQYRSTLIAPQQAYPATGYRITNLNAGIYTFTVKDNVTGCDETLEYEITQVDASIGISASANSQTFCTPANGDLFVRVTNLDELTTKLGYTPTFDFEIYQGELNTAPGTGWKDRANGVDQYNNSGYEGADPTATAYTIFAWFNGHRVCIGSDTAYVAYIHNAPLPTAEQEAYLTICDPDRPNAVANAHVNGITEGYIFTWYKGSVHPDSLHSTGSNATGLSFGTYVVEVFDELTQCIGTTSVEVQADYPGVGFPETWLVATASTNCNTPNGSMKVAVTNAGDFDFTWYAGEVADPTKQLASGPAELLNLAEGFYTVVATDKANGCVSTAVTKYLGGNYIFPDYEIMITPATCSVGGSVRIVNLSGQTQTYTVLDANGNTVLDLTNMIAGQYMLQVTSPDGCDKSEPFEVTDEVAPYNGITANNDGQNDYFHLACIEMFPQNLVRIYNRAGGLVFEIAGYDNNLKSFDGRGNRGMYLGGKDLPAGTYYWVLFKNNVNEKPKTGFLEIIR